MQIFEKCQQKYTQAGSSHNVYETIQNLLFDDVSFLFAMSNKFCTSVPPDCDHSNDALPVHTR